MSLLRIRLAAGALAGAFVAGGSAAAQAHAVCGDGTFPATLAIDDAGVTDELALPTLEWLPQNSDGVGEFDANFSWSKTIFPNRAVSVGYSASGHGAGIIAQLDLLMDDIAPNSLGKPIFSRSLPMFTGAR